RSLGVHLDSDGVVAVHQRLVQGGAPAAHRVEDGQLRGEHVAGGAHGHEREVQQQLREVLVGLPGVLLDREQVAVEDVQGLDRDGPQQLALPPEQGVQRGDVRQVGDVLLGQVVGLEGDVGDAADRGLGDLADSSAQNRDVEDPELGASQTYGAFAVDAVERGQDEDRELCHGPFRHEAVEGDDYRPGRYTRVAGCARLVYP